MDLIVRFVMNILSRKFEFQADDFAYKLGYHMELARSLIKLQIQNLSTMDADTLYAAYHFSHPILTERFGAIGWRGDGKVDGAAEKESKAEKASGREL